MIDPLPTWLTEFEKLPPDSDGTKAPKEIANFLDQRVTKKLGLKNSPVTLSPPPQFTWQKGIFQPLFAAVAMIPSIDPLTPALKIAAAWQSATVASTMIISAGAAMNPPPPGTNGIVGTAVAVIDPATLALAVSGLISDLVSAKPAAAAAAATLPRAMYKAFTTLTYTITGIDTKPPPTGPIPFVLPLTGVM